MPVTGEPRPNEAPCILDHNPNSIQMIQLGVISPPPHCSAGQPLALVTVHGCGLAQFVTAAAQHSRRFHFAPPPRNRDITCSCQTVP